MSNDRILSTLGLAMKAGRLSSGEVAVEQAVKGFKAFLVIVAGDASENTKKKMHNMCDFYEVPIYEYADRDQLGSCIGKEFRSSVAVLDSGFAKSLIKKLDNERL